MSSDDDSSNLGGVGQFGVGLVALIVSLIAFLATMMQVLQQYYASAAGYANCNEKVMGHWAKTKRRRFNWSELRFEVLFDAPVIFVSPPTNDRGPIPGEDIYFLDGTQKSLDETWTTDNMDLRKEYLQLSTKDRLHTADNERASWFILLYAIQRMESKSREWQQKQYGPPGVLCEQYGLPKLPPSLKEHHTLTAALQRKRKSWDTMPPNIVKPYATTTMCHLIEMIAALGIYWKEFDRRKDRYWAEGNGFLVLGRRVAELGVMFSLQVYGQCEFGNNRVIPVENVKELCFGYVSTIFQQTMDSRRLQVPSDMPENLAMLVMATRREVAESLRLIGCNNNTVNYYLEEGSRTSHLFPVTFELMGMLSRNFHIDNSSFTFIPNPTPDRWDKKPVSMWRVMEAFKNLVGMDVPGARRNRTIVNRLKHHAEEILTHYTEEDGPERLLSLRVMHMALNDADEILTARPHQASKATNASPEKPDDATRQKANEVLTPTMERQNGRRKMVQDVLRSHLQEVLRVLNELDDRGSENLSLRVPDRMPGTSPRISMVMENGRTKLFASKFEDMDDVPADERQQLFMEVYFEVIRPRVVPVASLSTERRASLVGDRPGSVRSLRVADAGHMPSRPSSPLARVVTSVAASVVSDDGAADSGNESDVVANRNANGVATAAATTADEPVVGEDKVLSLAQQPASHDDIWCTLVFRMICWLMMHDFHKLDVQLSKSELLGSRMPVYIS
ncbi:hypothetical protein VHEMI05513 [[Torrubiella] hemipterigena]|uniref:Modin n=1 Tax=[Torrubiella] hemipterigena TaxID=1531966 RepID=A0A0A1THB0_9HYPO|nr:hypothetical protein VHEMI05513 [[Torrubiella] hemipterigena]